MMKKLLALSLIAALTLMGLAALAETYVSDDLSFEYEDQAFEIAEDDRTDDETTVVLTGKVEAWGQTYIRFYLHDLRDGEALPTMADFEEMPDTTVTQADWNGYKDVFMYTLNNDDGTSQSFFIAPVVDNDGEVEDLLTVEIGITAIQDEDVAMGRDDLISAVVDTLKVDD